MGVVENLEKDLEQRLGFHTIGKRQLHGDITLCSFICVKRVNCTRITVIDLMELMNIVNGYNLEGSVPLPSCIIATADKKEKMICIAHDPHCLLSGGLIPLFFGQREQCKNNEISSISSLEDAVLLAFSDCRVCVSVVTEEEDFDETGATCFMEVTFAMGSSSADSLAFDIDTFLSSISKYLSLLNLNTVECKLYDVQREWKNMRLCISVEKKSKKIHFIEKNRKDHSEINRQVNVIHNGKCRKGLFLFPILSIFIVFLVVVFFLFSMGIWEYDKERVLSFFI
jgi:hypothetical protein